MPTLPPTNPIVPVNPHAPRAQQIRILAADFAAQFGDAAGNAFLKLANANPQYSPQQIANAFGVAIATKGVAQAIAEGASGLGGFLQAGANAGGSVLGQDAAGANDWKNLLVRIGEFIVGGLLVAVGLNAMLRKSTVYQQAQKAAVSTASKGVL